MEENQKEEGTKVEQFNGIALNDDIKNGDFNQPSQEGKRKNKKKKIIIIILIFVLLLVTLVLFLSFTNKKEEKVNTTKTDSKKVYSEYRMSGNQLENFDLKFLQLENNNKNAIYSPLSIKYALEMLSEGAKGKSKDQIDALIGDYKAKKYDNNLNMSFANALFIKNSFKNRVKDDYQNKLQQKYYADVIFDEFTNPNNINSWVSHKTFNLINNLIDNVDEAQFILVNALAIDMEWKNLIQATCETYKNQYSVKYAHEKYSEYIPVICEDSFGSVNFNNKTINSKASEIGASINNYDIINELGEDHIRQTISKEYQEWLNGGGCGGGEEDMATYVDKFITELKSNYGRVDSSTDFKLYNDDEVKVFSKELKEYNGTTLEYIGIMPINKDLNQFIKDSDAKSINSIIDKIKSVDKDNFENGKITKITGGIPLFKYDYQLNLMEDLKSLGVTDVFDPNKTDISNITDDKGVVIGDVSHKANIEFSNEGIKAAAATQAGGWGSAGCGFEHLYDVPVVTIDLTFDNPYMYIIRDKNTKEVWFIGTVYEPLENTLQNSKVINE